MLAAVLCLGWNSVGLLNPSPTIASPQSKEGLSGCSLLSYLDAGERAEESAYLRTILPNGAIVVVENLPKAKVLSVQLFASSKGVAENPQTHGWRHLLEHLIEKGPDKGLPARLEAQGILILSETHRDAMQFSMVAPPAMLEPALAAMNQLLAPLQTSEAEVKRETAVIVEEIALHPAPKRLGPAVWSQVFGDGGLDPVGRPETISKASPGALEQLRRRHFASPNLIISICGPNLGLDSVTKRVRELLPATKDPVEPSGPNRPPPEREHGRLSTSDGEVIGVVTPGWNEPDGPAVLASALALASERNRAWVVYTPSTAPGLVLLGADSDEPGLSAWLAKRTSGELAALFARGKALALGWLKERMATPYGRAGLRGLLYAQSPYATPEAFEEALRGLNPAAFQAAAAKFVKAAGE